MGFENNDENRTLLVLKEELLNKLKSSSVMVIGLGGVGGLVAEGLARLGVSNLILIDGDMVELSNLNRQIEYTKANLSEYKTSALKKRLADISDVQVELRSEFLTSLNLDLSYFKDVTFVFDCIDDMKIKAQLIALLFVNNIPFISSMGLGKRMDSTKVVYGNLDEVTGDRLAKKLKIELSHNPLIKMKKIPVVYSKEAAANTGVIVGSTLMVPNAGSLAMLSYFINFLNR